MRAAAQYNSRSPRLGQQLQVIMSRAPRLQLGVVAQVQELERGQPAQDGRHAREQVSGKVQRRERGQPLQRRQQAPHQGRVRLRPGRAAGQVL